MVFQGGGFSNDFGMPASDVVRFILGRNPSAEGSASRIQIGFGKNKVGYARRKQGGNLDGNGTPHAVAEEVELWQAEGIKDGDDSPCMGFDGIAEVGGSITESRTQKINENGPAG